MEKGESVDMALKMIRPPIFFKNADSFKSQLRNWTHMKLLIAMNTLLKAETDSKTTGMPIEAVCGRALMRIAQAARR